ncbi:hypothetical protein AQ490_01680 [Wenjunlia vitaminophila]|uniref:Cytoskeleton protein RodZ-like C-terminal domain-containing protein n=1 Tax=Wenjunlia vitaminophila TaxID=76728 RepID=A0A0T6LZU9_WENVI|nr:helix-turn-helix domain-containing protein [Wenjunlia vitaminophila]KRV51488.1 hypothetical protein AQ490_01680 [Wenjunlia vitaminophila]
MSIGNLPPGDSVPDPQPSVGRVLAQARLDAGLTVDEVSARTRIRVPIVRAIEEDDFSRCGGDFYARGHVRQIAKALGIDSGALVARYDAEYGAPTPTQPAQLFETERVRTDRRRPNWTAAMVAAIAVVIAFVGFNLVRGGDDSGSPRAGGSSASPTAKPTDKSKEPGSKVGRPAPTDSAIAAAPPDKVTVKATAVDDRSWISATSKNGKSLFQGTLEKGSSETFTDDEEIKLVIGNAGAIKMFVNGKDLGTPGEPGDVARLTFTPGDPEAG